MELLGPPMQPATKQAAIQSGPVPSDAPTVIGIALIAYMLADMLHERLGHGGRNAWRFQSGEQPS
jgi:hypothetical protein